MTHSAALTVQIIGTRRSPETRKAVRFFSERGVSYHFRDIGEKPLTRRELENIARSVPVADLVDRDGREYERLGLAHMEYDALEEIVDHPLLLAQPVVRCGTASTAGAAEAMWLRWIRGGGV